MASAGPERYSLGMAELHFMASVLGGIFLGCATGRFVRQKAHEAAWLDAFGPVAAVGIAGVWIAFLAWAWPVYCNRTRGSHQRAPEANHESEKRPHRLSIPNSTNPTAIPIPHGSRELAVTLGLATVW